MRPSKAPKAPSVAPSEPASAPTIEVAGELASDPAPPAELAPADDREPDSVSGARLVRPSRRPPSLTASFRPVVPATGAPPRKRPTLRALLPVASLLLSSAGVGFLVFGGSAGSAELEAARAAERGAEPASKSAAEAPRAVEAPPAPVAAATASPVRAATPEAARAGAAPAPVTPPASAADVTRVELEVYPPDAAVGYLGIMQKGGPRYSFDVPRGKKIAVEIARKGFGTRKVTLDGSQTKLTIGLRKSPTAP